MGDFKARSPAWYCQTACTLAEARGTLITESFPNSNLLLFNLDSPTRQPSHRDPTSPNLSIVSSHISLRFGVTHPQLRPPSKHCRTGKFFPNEPPHRTFTNLGKSECNSYIREAEESSVLLGLPSSCSTGDLQFRKILNSSAKHHIFHGHIPNMISNLIEITK